MRWEPLGDNTWCGIIESDFPKIIENAPWEELYHEEDFCAINDQLLAEDMGYDTI